jgi:tetratricopeptide (TPR) repeat protein
VSSAQDTASAWRRVEEAPPGSRERAERLLEALEALEAAPDEPLSNERLQLAWSTGVEAARDLRLQDAIAIQWDLAARHPADWSAMDLALSLGLAGRPLEADVALERALVRARGEGRPTAELWNRRGLLWLGAGRERLGRDHLGRALARGSTDAAVVLAHLDLSRGDRDAARAGFRSRLYDDPPGAWALRGWGLSLLPSADPEPAPEHPEEPTP